MEVPRANVDAWQDLVDTVAHIVDIPAALIMRLNDPNIEVFVSSRTEGNPYHPGDKEAVWGSGLYCETVIKSRDKLLVPNALSDEKWSTNPDIKLGMVSYLGFPIPLPDGGVFGTICVLDTKENRYSEDFEKLILTFRDLVQSDLELVYMNQMLGDENRKLEDYRKEIQVLRERVPICSYCKSIRDEQGDWHSIEDYLLMRSHGDLSHGICPDCAKRHFPDMKLDMD